MSDLYVYRCPVCAKRFRTRDKFEPCCTGPSESRDDHEMTLMRLEAIDRQQIDPRYAEARTLRPLIL